MLRRMGRPGLLGTMARTAVITGTASATANAMARRQMRREQEAEAAYAEAAPQAMAPPPQPAAAPAEDLGDQLSRLATLHAQGALSDEEFAAAKQRLLG